MTRLVAVMVAISRAVFGPGAIRAPANCAVPAAATAAAASAARRRRPPPARPRPARRAVIRTWDGRRPGGARRARASPGRAAPHQRVVGVARLAAHASPRRGRPDRVRRSAGGRGAAASRRPQSQRQVRVLAERPGEPLVEAAGLGQRGPPVGHVRGDPARRGQAHRAPFPVGRPPAAGHGHGDPALHSRHLRRQAGQVPGELVRQSGATRTSSSRKATQRRADGSPASVARRGRAAPPLATTRSGSAAAPATRAGGVGRGRSSTTTTCSGGGPTPRPARPGHRAGRAARWSGSLPRSGSQPGSRVTAGAPGTGRWPARPPAWSRSTPGRP